MEYADEKKKLLLDWLLPKLRAGEIIRMELAFSDASRRADIVVLGSRRLVAIEVKSERDSTRRLAAQIVDYQDMFLESWVAATPKHLDSIRRLVPRGVGLIELPRLAKPRIVRKAIVKSSLPKNAAARWLRVRELLQMVRSKPKAPDIEKLRQDVATEWTRDALSKFVLKTLHQRHAKTFARFLDERGHILTLDDVHILTLQRTTARAT